MRKFTLCLLILTLSLSAFSQKVKYKDVYALLEVGKYEEALPILTQYLENNPDDGSANLYMGVVAQEYEKDCDKAQKYFEKGLGLIDQKVLDKDKKFYGLWNRRNLRTGKYDVLLDNIQLDVDERLASCGS